LDLCVLEGFDSVNDVLLCPLERNALYEFYTGAKGQEWTVSKDWLSQYDSHCMWYGVMCSEMNETIALRLESNGLSGTLSTSIAKLKSLSVLDLSDNDIKVSALEKCAAFSPGLIQIDPCLTVALFAF
jgi:hypothetical protein